MLAILACSFCQEITFPAVVSQGHDGVCPSAKESAAIREKITEQVLFLLNNSYAECCQVDIFAQAELILL